MTEALANALAEDPHGVLVASSDRAAYPGCARRLQAKLAVLRPEQLLAVERIVDQIAAANGAGPGHGSGGDG